MACGVALVVFQFVIRYFDFSTDIDMHPLQRNIIAVIGDLAEIIILKRSLKTEEVKAIENYLGSKYGISVS